MKDTVHIDGSQGEGGGQILRTALTLSALGGQPVHFTNIRAGRPRAGLRPQHLATIGAIAEICAGEVQGARLNATDLQFQPGKVKAGDYRFAVGTAGSACLVFQAVLWPLLFAEGNSRVVFEGGTHNLGAPPFDFIERCFLPIVRQMGASVEARLARYGFAPAGGGRFVVEIEGGCELSAIDLCDAGALRSRRATALVCKLPGTIAIRELRAIREKVEWKNEECLPKVFDESDGPGNILILEMIYEALTEMISVAGERNVSAEDVAAMAAQELESYLEYGAPVGPHLADQLVLAFALAGAGSFRTGSLTRHALTNIEVVRSFLDTRIEQAPQDDGSTLVSFGQR